MFPICKGKAQSLPEALVPMHMIPQVGSFTGTGRATYASLLLKRINAGDSPLGQWNVLYRSQWGDHRVRRISRSGKIFISETR